MRRISTSSPRAAYSTHCWGLGRRRFVGILSVDCQRIPVNQQRFWIIWFLGTGFDLVIVVEFHHLARYQSKLRVASDLARIRRHVVSRFWHVRWLSGSSHRAFASNVGLNNTGPFTGSPGIGLPSPVSAFAALTFSMQSREQKGDPSCFALVHPGASHSFGALSSPLRAIEQ